MFPARAHTWWTGRKQAGHTDQYALAVLFYELVSGAVPFASVFDTGDPVIMSNAVETKNPDLLPMLANDQNAALLKTLSKNPAERFSSCEEFVAALKESRCPAATTNIARESAAALKALSATPANSNIGLKKTPASRAKWNGVLKAQVCMTRPSIIVLAASPKILPVKLSKINPWHY